MKYIASLNDQNDLNTLHPYVRVKVQRLMEAMSDAGFPCTIVHAMRSMRTQAELYSQGRTKPGAIVTNAKPGQSYHNYGLAVDLLPLVCAKDRNWAPDHQAWQVLGALAKAMGFTWGGAWNDKPHVEYHKQVHHTQLRKWLDEGTMDSVWAHMDQIFRPNQPPRQSTITNANIHAR
jgi:peptidoglycan LD-endopeptidase CwlK